jgi:phosphate transport system substrate-binding protein
MSLSVTRRTITMLVSAALVACCVVASATAGQSKHSGGQLVGAGSTFVQPLVSQWQSAYPAAGGANIVYQPIGSGGGIQAITNRTVDFGASDAPLTADQLTNCKGCVQIPWALGGTSVMVNLKTNAHAPLHISGPVLAQIYLGQITSWNDPAIKALNPGMSLPSTGITVVHRSDSSGTTAGFTTFLAATDPTWASTVGPPDKEVKWPTGTGAAKNSGVAAAVTQTDGAIGYVEQAYAIENGFTYAAVKNSSGQFVLPTIQNTSAAANGIKVPADLGISTINSPAAGAYPIVSQTFLVAYKDPCKDGKASSSVASGLKKFFTYAFGPGQQTLGPGSNQLPYAPLPSSLADKDNAQLGTMTCNGSSIS